MEAVHTADVFVVTQENTEALSTRVQGEKRYSRIAHIFFQSGKQAILRDLGSVKEAGHTKSNRSHATSHLHTINIILILALNYLGYKINMNSESIYP